MGVAMVTGGSRGIGKGIVLELARRGFDCAIGFTANASTAEETLGEVATIGRRGIIVRGDIGLRLERERIVEETHAKLGRVDVAAVAMGLLPFSTGQVIDVDGGFHLRRL